MTLHASVYVTDYYYCMLCKLRVLEHIYLSVYCLLDTDFTLLTTFMLQRAGGRKIEAQSHS